MEVFDKIGYQKPVLTAQRWGICMASVLTAATLATAIKGKFKSHLTFGGTAGTIGTLAFENKHPQDWVSKSEKRMKWVFAGSVLGILWVSRYLTGRLVEPITIKNAMGRGLYHAAVGTATVCGYESFRQHLEKSQGF